MTARIICLDQMHEFTLSVIVPVFNEQTFVESSLRRLFATTFEGISHREVIVIDDCSTDSTPDILRKLQSEFKFTMLRHSKNAGKGAAIRTGIALAKNSLVVFHDADLEYDPQDINKLLQPIFSGQADVVYGSRFVGSEMRRLLFYWHEKCNQLITLCLNMATNLNFTDVETCYKLFKREQLSTFDLVSQRFRIEIELSVKAAKHKLRIYEVSIAYFGRTYEQGKKINWKDGVSALW